MSRNCATGDKAIICWQGAYSPHITVRLLQMTGKAYSLLQQ